MGSYISQSDDQGTPQPQLILNASLIYNLDLLLWMADGCGSIEGGAKSDGCDEEMAQTLTMDRHSKPLDRLRGLL